MSEHGCRFCGDPALLRVIDDFESEVVRLNMQLAGEVTKVDNLEHKVGCLEDILKQVRASAHGVLIMTEDVR